MAVPSTTLAFDETMFEQSIVQRFEQQVSRTPDSMALVGAAAYTYRELNTHANRIAEFLLANTSVDEKIITIYLADKVATVAAILGVLKAGKIYLVLDPENPAARIHAILKDAQAQVVISNGVGKLTLHEAAEGLTVRVLDLDDLPNSHDPDNPQIYVLPTDVAAMFYTSGSTGEPKAILWSHCQILHNIWGYTATDQYLSSDRFSLLRPCSFGASTAPIFCSLLSGGTLYTFEPKADGLIEMRDWIVRNEITIFHPPIALFRKFLEMLPQGNNFPSVRCVVLGGEALRPDDVHNVRARFSQICVVVHQLASHEGGGLIARNPIHGSLPADAKIVPIGVPVPGKEISFLDEDGKPVADGEVGEMVIRSRYLAVGYWNRPEEDRKTFVPDPDGGDVRTCYTGDLGRVLPDGSLEFLGRKDFRLKIRGHRVEVQEIEAALLKHPMIKDVVIAAHEGNRLVAYYVPTSEPAPAASQLRPFLTKSLPDYMIPAAFVVLDEIPLSPRGKVDRARLPVPDFRLRDPNLPYEPPHDPVERFLVYIWQEVLGIAPIGITDVYTDLGGDSLRALEILSRIEVEFNRRIPLSVLINTPTIADLTEVLRREPIPAPWPSLVPLRTTGNRPPLFLVHGAGGHVFIFSQLTKLLDAELPVYALQAQGLDGVTPPFSNFPDMAAFYLREIRSVQAHGPYYLAGHSGGGRIIYEMARQLEAQGEQVALLAALDSVVTGRLEEPPQWQPERRKKRNHAEALRGLNLFGKVKYLFGFAKHWVRVRVSRKLKGVLVIDHRADLKPEQRVRNHTAFAARRYQMKPYQGKIVLFRTAQMKAERHDPRMYWEPWAKGGVELIDIPGDHDSMYREPDVKVLANRLQEYLDAAYEANKAR